MMTLLSTGDPSRGLYTSARILLSASLLGAPLAFGAVQPWAWGAMLILLAGSLVLWAIGCARAGFARPFWSWMYVPAGAVLVIACLQSINAWTFDLYGTREAILKLLACVIEFFLVQQLFCQAPQALSGRNRAPACAFTSYFIVASYTALIAVFAVVQFFAAPGLLYASQPPRWGGYVFGPYVNHNHYAGLMEMLIPLSMGSVLALRARHPARVLLAFGVSVAFVSVILSGSRGGTLALAAELLVLALALVWERGGRGGRLTAKRIGYGAAGIAIMGAAVLLLGSGEIWQRWERLAHSPHVTVRDRKAMAIDSVRLSRACLWKGAGLGAFGLAYPRYQSWATDEVVESAHNDYAQFVAEMGASGWILIPLSLGLLLWLGLSGLIITRSPAQSPPWSVNPFRYLKFAAVLGVCGVLVHSCCDFNLHIPANAAWFSATAAIATADPWMAKTPTQ